MRYISLAFAATLVGLVLVLGVSLWHGSATDESLVLWLCLMLPYFAFWLFFMLSVAIWNIATTPSKDRGWSPRYMLSIFAPTVTGMLSLLGLSVWPGMLSDQRFWFGFCLMLPFVGWWLVLVISTALWDIAKRPSKTQGWGLWSATAIAVTLVLLVLNLPQLAVFALYRSEFERVGKDINPIAERDRWTLDVQIGPYFVEQYGTDRAGGVYFVTHTGPDGIGPDEMQYGFAFRPNRDGVPFGRARHRVYHLFGDWYTFAGSSD